MLRVQSIRVQSIAALVVSSVIGVALPGCSSSTAPSWMPDWMTVKPPFKALQFESSPPGADATVVATTGQAAQTCKTPCSLSVPLSKQSVTFSLNGYISQTLPVDVHDTTDFAPNPVQVTLQAAPAKPKTTRPKSPDTAGTSGGQR
jgi:hypothetical protein